jgi:hypothetical protein
MSVDDSSNLSGSVAILTKLAGFPQIWRDLINLAGFLNLSVFSQSLKFSRSCQDMEKQHKSENHHIRNNALETSRENRYDVNMGCILSKETGGFR